MMQTNQIFSASEENTSNIFGGQPTTNTMKTELYEIENDGFTTNWSIFFLLNVEWYRIWGGPWMVLKANTGK